MGHKTGTAFLLKMRNEDGPSVYQTVAGLRTTQLSINGDMVSAVNHEPDGWRDLLSGGGTRSVSVSASGIFLGSEAESAVRAHALAGTLDDYELSFEDGERLQGRFLVQRLDFLGDYNGERTYTLQLESSGPVTPV